jgi:iron complex outermembrane recepter protein
MRRRNSRFLQSAGLLALGLAASPVLAQEVEQSSPPEAEQADGNEIIVSARRRDERLQDVPESVTAFSAKDIANAGISNFRDVADLTPNLSQLDNYRPGLARFQVRGLITPQIGDPPLAFVFDGVTAPDQEFVNQDLVDIERIEVLRGAQGALYGRGAVGGAVNIVTKQPTNDVSGNVQASYARGDTWRLSGVVSGPIAEDSVYFRLGGYYTNGDGLIENTFLNTGADFVRDYSIFGLLKADLGPDTNIDIRGQYGNSRSGVGYYQAVTFTQDSIEDFSIPTSQNVLGIDRRKIYQISAKLEHRFDFATLTAVAGYSNADDNTVSDGDYVALATDGATFFPAVQEALLKTSAWTFEGRLTSTGDGPFSWALGSFYQDRKRNSDFSFFDDANGNAPNRSGTIDRNALLFAIIDEGRSKAWALSAQAGYEITDQLEVTIAGRFDHDRRSSFDRRDVAATSARATFEQFQPKISLSYKVTPDVIFYGGYSKGFRSGGFNEFSGGLTPRIYGKEISDSYELGFKATLLDRVLTFNGALFRIDQSNAQLTQFNPTSFTLENVAIDSVRSQGIEVEIGLRPAQGLSLRASFGYTDSEIRSFTANPAVVGFAMPYIAKYNLSLSADYEIPVTDTMDAILHGDYRRNGPRSFTLDFPGLRSEAHDFVGLRAGLRTDSWQLTAFVDNLFNERQPEDIFSLFNGAVDMARQPNRPRTYGVEARFDF